MGGQFAPELPGQFPPELGGQLEPEQMVCFLRNYMVSLTGISKMRDNVINGNIDAMVAIQNEEKKKTGRLPELFYKSNSWKSVPLEGYSDQEFIKKVKASKGYDEGDTYVMLGHDWTETKYISGTKNIDHTSIHFYLVIKDKNGNCAFRKMTARQNFENGKYSTPIIHEAQKYGKHDRKEGYVTNYFSCDNLPK